MPKRRLGTLRVACLALMAGSVLLGLIVLVTTAIPLRQTHPVAAGLAFLLAVIAFVLAGVGLALAALSRRNRSRPPPPTGKDTP